MAAQPHYTKCGMLSSLTLLCHAWLMTFILYRSLLYLFKKYWNIFVMPDSWHLFYTGLFCTYLKNTEIMCLELSKPYSCNFKREGLS
jgi:hypothetical protein